MSTRNLLLGLDKLAKVAKQLAHDVADFNDDGKVNWEDVVAASKDDKFKELVGAALGRTKRADVYAALAEINRRRHDLAAGRSYAEMTNEELDQYEALRSTERVLYQAADKLEGSRSRFLAWLVNDALPVLASTLKVVLPLF
jgi:hypothetical protein